MALYSSHTSMVQRSNGQNAVAASAYNSRSKLELEVTDKETGVVSKVVYDYSAKGGLAYSKITAPDDAPDWVHDREKLWNKAEQTDKRVDSQPARKIIKALPVELNLDQQIALVEEFTAELVNIGMVVDANIHNDKEGNPHAHFMLTTRRFVENRYGEKVFGNKNREWGKVAFVKWHRVLWAELQNEHLALHGFDARVSEKSYKDLGLDLIPGVHKGPAEHIKNAELVELNRQIAEENARRIQENPGLVLDKLNINKPVFTKEEIATELEKFLSAGIDVAVEKKECGDADKAGDSTGDIESLNEEFSRRFMMVYERIMSSPELTLIVEADLKGRELYTTTKRLELEERFEEVVKSLDGSNRHALGISDSDLDELSFGEKVAEKVRDLVEDFASKLEKKTGLKFSIAGKRPPLSEEQRKAVIGILNGKDIAILQGIPGAGKTTTMREIVRQYKKAGYIVIGITASSSAALQLAKETGIECKNASLWRKEWLKANGKEFDLALRGDYYKEEKYKNNRTLLTDKHVVIIDEASMMELSQMDYFTHEVKKAGAKLIKIGDNNQLSAVGWGGAFKKAINICGSENLEESRRQQNPAHQEATKLLSQYRLKEAVGIYLKEGNILIDKTKHESRQRLVNDSIASYIEKSNQVKKDNLAATRETVICTYTNKESAKLNAEVRELLKEAGVIKGLERRILVGNKHLNLVRGEQIVFTRNFNRLGRSGIYNGEVGTVLKISDPDELGHAAVAVLVNKANGKQEKIVLDTKGYSAGDLFDYGYAVTSHKLQGATVDQLFVLHDKQVGYEAFNVMMTRHRQDVRLYANEEGLLGTLYESLDIDAKKAQSRYDLEGEREDLVLNGLVKNTAKRVNNSFAKDYFNMGLTAADWHLKRYIESNKEVIELIRQITLWQQKQLRHTGVKPELWGHHLWEDFKEKRAEREVLAKNITGNYEIFKDRLIQLGMNYATIEKYASDNKEDKYLVTENRTYLHVNSVNYQQLVEAIEKDNREIAKQSYTELKLEIAESYAKLQDAHNKMQVLQEEEHGIINAIEVERNYREVLMPAFLGRIYKESSEQVLGKYQSLVKEHGEEEAASIVGKGPVLLGRLKGFGIGRIISFTGSRKDAVSVSENLEKQLKGFNRSKEMEQRLAAELTDKNFTSKMSQLQQEIKRLKEQLPSSLDEAFLNKVGEVLSNDRRVESKIAGPLGPIRESDIFQYIHLRNLQEEGEKYEMQERTEKQMEEAKTDVGSLSRSQKVEKEALPILDFEEVKKAITPSVIEQLFRHYGQKLNPDGKFKKKGSQLFCGSLNINLKNGKWYRFSDGSKGDLVQLVMEASGVDTKTAFEIIGGYAGVSAKVREENRGVFVGKARGDSEQALSDIGMLAEVAKDPWQIHSIIPADAAKFNPVKNLYGTLKKNNWKVEANYEYKNKDGDLIGYVVRVLDKEGKKQTLPVTYCFNLEQNKSTWKLKGFSDNGYKSIYGAEKLASQGKPILIVEGEKTADKASKLLPEYSVISWMGGVQSSDKVNWKELEGREVIIWPDNDTAGQQAARVILQAINKANGFSGFCSIVDVKALDLPNKWDLADKLPAGTSIIHIKEAIQACQVKNKSLTDYELLAGRFQSQEEQKRFWQQAGIGIIEQQTTIKEAVSKETAIKAVLSNEEVISYAFYAKARDKLDISHSFLDFKDELFRDYLSASMASFLVKNEGSQDAEKVSELFNLNSHDKSINSDPSGSKIVGIVDIALQIYEKSRTNFVEHRYRLCDKFKQNHQELAAVNPTKAEIYTQLMKDFTLLHQEELGVKTLSTLHQGKLSTSLAYAIKGYDTNYKGSNLPLDEVAYKAIATTVHAQINTSDWWQSIVTDNIKFATKLQNEKLKSANRELNQAKNQIRTAIKEAGIEDKNQTKAIHKRAMVHTLEYMYHGGKKCPEEKLIKVAVERAVYEEKHIGRCMRNAEDYMMKDGKLDQLDTAGGKIFQKLMAEKLVKAESYIKQEHSELQVHEIRAKAEKAYFNYQTEVKKLLTTHPAIATLKEELPLAAKYLAENIVEFKNNYEEKLLTPQRIRAMTEIAKKQSEIAKEVEKQMMPHDNEITSGKHKVLSPDVLTGQIKAFDREMTAKLVATNLKSELTHELLMHHGHHMIGHAVGKERDLEVNNSEHHDQIAHHEDWLNRAAHRNLEHDHHNEITHEINQTRNMQQEYHEQKHEEQQRSLNAHHSISLGD